MPAVQHLPVIDASCSHPGHPPGPRLFTPAQWSAALSTARIVREPSPGWRPAYSIHPAGCRSLHPRLISFNAFLSVAHKLMREIEIFPLTQLHSETLANLFFTIFHPLKAWKEFRGRAAYKISQIRASDD